MERPEQSAAKVAIAIFVFVIGCNSRNVEKATNDLKWYDEASLQLQNQNGIFTNNGVAFSGIVYSIAENKKDTVAVSSFFNGKEHGEWRKYFDNGKLMERRCYAEGKKTGLYEAWWPNGEKRLIYHFENGEYEGSCKDWSESGVLISDMHYATGHESGNQKQYYEDGKVKANYTMIDGRRYGLLGTKNCVNVSDSVFALPYYNTPDFTPHFINNKNEVSKNITHIVGTFSFQDQNGKIISNKTVKGKIHVANFMFTSCGSICPKMTSNLVPVSEAFSGDSNVLLLSYSVTPWIDTKERLLNYKNANNIHNKNWHFLTGKKGAIYELARKSYFAEEDLGFTKDSTEFLHTEHILLVDGSGRIRGIYNGTLQLETEQLIKDIYTLKREN